MRKDKSFSDAKLTREEFSKKYWMRGKAKYQYHTGEIEDGRDEREQFIFNNIRALKSMIDFKLLHDEKTGGELLKLITILAVSNAVATLITLMLVIVRCLK